MENFIITGVDKSGKRFDPIHTDSPEHYNIWKGTLWRMNNNGKRTMAIIYSIYARNIERQGNWERKKVVSGIDRVG